MEADVDAAAAASPGNVARDCPFRWSLQTLRGDGDVDDDDGDDDDDDDDGDDDDDDGDWRWKTMATMTMAMAMTTMMALLTDGDDDDAQTTMAMVTTTVTMTMMMMAIAADPAPSTTYLTRRACRICSHHASPTQGHRRWTQRFDRGDPAFAPTDQPLLRGSRPRKKR